MKGRGRKEREEEGKEGRKRRRRKVRKEGMEGKERKEGKDGRKRKDDLQWGLRERGPLLKGQVPSAPSNRANPPLDLSKRDLVPPFRPVQRSEHPNPPRHHPAPY
jgi:hypothetical protein